MEKIKTIISAIISFIIDSLFPVKKLLLQHLDDVKSVQEITFQTHFYQLLLVYGFVFFVFFFGILWIIKSIWS